MKSNAAIRLMARVLLILACTAGMTPSLWAQNVQVLHFVAPSYPPLARQAMISGQVLLELTLAKDGTVKDSSVVINPLAASGNGTPGNPHPFLVGESQTCVKEWKFRTSGEPQKVRVIFYFGFSGTTRDDNPRTRVTADFEVGAPRVFVVTDAVSAVNPN